jgi:anti-anti-sigma factor
MKVDVQAHGSVTVMVPHGALVASEVDSFRQHVEPAVQQRAGGRIVLDFRDVPYVDSAGIEALVELLGCGSGGGDVQPRLAQLADTCREALDLTDCLSRLSVFDTVENAIRSLRR